MKLDGSELMQVSPPAMLSPSQVGVRTLTTPAGHPSPERDRDQPSERLGHLLHPDSGRRSRHCYQRLWRRHRLAASAAAVRWTLLEPCGNHRRSKMECDAELLSTILDNEDTATPPQRTWRATGTQQGGSLPNAADLSSGQYKVTAYAVDRAGNCSPTSESTFTATIPGTLSLEADAYAFLSKAVPFRQVRSPWSARAARMAPSPSTTCSLAMAMARRLRPLRDFRQRLPAPVARSRLVRARHAK